jgi:hypothetical protein
VRKRFFPENLAIEVFQYALSNEHIEIGISNLTMLYEFGYKLNAQYFIPNAQ